MKKLFTLFLLLVVTGCGGGGGGSAAGGGGGVTTDTVSGVAATSTVISGTVYLKDSAATPKELSKAIAADGSYSFDVTGMTKPYLLKAVGTANGTSYTIYSMATDKGTANINPMTHLVVAIAAGGADVATIYNAPQAATVQAMAGKLAQAVTDVQTSLNALLLTSNSATVNPISDAYKADHTGLDGMLDKVKISVADGTVTITNVGTGATIFTGQVSNIKGGTITTANIPASTYTISGTVTYNGSGLSGVTVTTSGGSGTTISDGSYSISGLGNGSCTVTPSKTGYSFTPQTTTISSANVTLNFTATVTVTASAAYSVADMSGTWMNHFLAAGDAPEKFGWLYSSMAYDTNGNVTTYSSITDSILGTNAFAFNTSTMGLNVSSDGTITYPTAPALLAGIKGTMSKSKDIMVSTGTFYPGSNTGVGKYNLQIGVKKSGSFSTADLAGTWNMHALQTGDGSSVNKWMYGTSVMTAAGVSTDNFIADSTGAAGGTQTKNYKVSSDGIVTSTELGSNFHAVMSSDKNLIVATVSDSGGYLLIICVKAGTTFTQADLAGTWSVHSLLSGDGGNAWMRGNMVVDSTGATTFNSSVLSDGTTPVMTGAGLTITSNGIITGPSSGHGVLSSDKNLLIVTSNANMNNKTVVQLFIAMKR